MATVMSGDQILEPFTMNVVNDAQRIVIRALSKRSDAEKISYAPERDLDRKIWYLELLEE